MSADSIESLICVECNQEILPDFQDRIIQSGMIICLDCRACITCHKIISDAELKLAIQHSLPVQHARCRLSTQPNATVPVEAYELHILNLARLIVAPDIDLSVETNKRRAELAQAQLWESFTMEQKYIHVKMMEACYSACYMSLKKDPKELKEALRERDSARTAVAHEKARQDKMRQLPSERKKLGQQDKFLAGMLASGILREQAIEIWKSKGRVWVE